MAELVDYSLELDQDTAVSSQYQVSNGAATTTWQKKNKAAKLNNNNDNNDKRKSKKKKKKKKKRNNGLKVTGRRAKTINKPLVRPVRRADDEDNDSPVPMALLGLGRHPLRRASNSLIPITTTTQMPPTAGRLTPFVSVGPSKFLSFLPFLTIYQYPMTT